MTTTSTLTALALLAVATGIATAQSGKPYASADPNAGARLAQKDCIACHARKFGGDATQIYLRDDRKVRTPEQLIAQVQLCNTELNLQYFPDDENAIAAHLDRDFYRFPR
jgi:hypothetical protein